MKNSAFMTWLFILLLFAVIPACQSSDDDDVDSDTQPNDDDNQTADDDQIDGDDDTAENECQSGHMLTFDLTKGSRNVPYPNVIFMKDDESSPTGFRVDIHGQVTTYLDQILKATTRYFLREVNQLSGFGLSTPIWLHANTAPNPALLPNAGTLSVEDPIFCAVIEEEGHQHYGELWPMDISYIEDVKLVQLVPHLPFAEDTTYACVARTNLCTEVCDCYQTPEHLQYVLRSEPDKTNADYDLLEPYRKKLQPLFKRLFDQYDIRPEEIVGATFFHTQLMTHDLLSIREQLEERALTSPPVVGMWTRQDSKHPDVDSVWETTYQTVNWQKGGVFDFDEDGNPVPNGVDQVTLRLTIPKSGVNGHEPPYPVALYGHGLVADRKSGKHVYETLAGQGIATLAIDWIYHGDRSHMLPIFDPMYAKIIQFLQFTPVLNPQKMRDNYRQGVADMIWLKHLARTLDHLDLAPYETHGDGIPDLDPSIIMYAGISMGAAHGTILAAVEPDIDTFLFMSGAANWRQTLTTSNDEAMMAFILKFMLDFYQEFFHFENPSDSSLYYQLQLSVADAGDPYGYARYVLDEPLIERPSGYTNILHQMSASDSITGGLGAAELARALGTTLLRPYVWQIDEVEFGDTPFNGPGTFQYDTFDHRFMLTPENPFFEAGHHQIAVYMRSAVDDGIATIINPLD